MEKQEILAFMQTANPQPIAEKELLKRLHIESDARHDVKRLLDEMTLNGDLIEVDKNMFALPEHLNLIVGYVQGNQKGFAFIIPKNREIGDIYVAADYLANALHGDLVAVQLQKSQRGKLPQGRVVKILQRGQLRLVGLYQQQRNFGVVIPENGKLPYVIRIEPANAGNALPNQIVVARITKYDERQRNPEGQIVEVLGYPDTPGMDEKIIIQTFELPDVFPRDALNAAAAIAEGIPADEIERRLDLRAQCIFTIDGENARDFDDAVSLERLANANYKLGVHIADVSFYVPVGTPIDREAYQRGTSVYFPDRAIPMLPERLSNQLCSLRPGEDRLTMSVFMEFDPTMKLVNYDIAPSVIRSQARFTYTKVRQILQAEDAALCAEYAAFVPTLDLMRELSELLLQHRMRRGSLDFDLPEPELVLDLQGNVADILKAERNLAHRLIEEFMLAANETVATHLTWLQIPMVYRTHDAPAAAKIDSLNEFIGSLGLHLRSTNALHPKDIQRLLKQVRHKPTEHLVNTLTLRALKQARYTVRNTGHFGLASTCYTHFTSPIRRYPDLMVHRILRQSLAGGGFTEPEIEARQVYLETAAEHSSVRERVAAEAERDLVTIKKLRFMRDRIGDVFDGVISGVAAFGVFVELREYFVEGLIHVTQLQDDYYEYRAETYSLVGEHFRKTYRVGDAVTVQIAHVDVAKRQIDLLLL